MARRRRRTKIRARGAAEERALLKEYDARRKERAPDRPRIAPRLTVLAQRAVEGLEALREVYGQNDTDQDILTAFCAGIEDLRMSRHPGHDVNWRGAFSYATLLLSEDDDGNAP